MTKGNRQISEERTAAASYILTYYQEVGNLTHWYAQYRNILAELKLKDLGEEGMQALEETEKSVLIKTLQSLRYYAHKSQIQYLCIMDSLKNKVDPAIKKAYERLDSEFIISLASIESYVIKMNGVLLNTVIKNLMETSQDIVDSVYDDG